MHLWHVIPRSSGSIAKAPAAILHRRLQHVHCVPRKPSVLMHVPEHSTSFFQQFVPHVMQLIHEPCRHRVGSEGLHRMAPACHCLPAHGSRRTASLTGTPRPTDHDRGLDQKLTLQSRTRDPLLLGPLCEADIPRLEHVFLATWCLRDSSLGLGLALFLARASSVLGANRTPLENHGRLFGVILSNSPGTPNARTHARRCALAGKEGAPLGTGYNPRRLLAFCLSRRGCAGSVAYVQQSCW